MSLVEEEPEPAGSRIARANVRAALAAGPMTRPQLARALGLSDAADHYGLRKVLHHLTLAGSVTREQRPKPWADVFRLAVQP